MAVSVTIPQYFSKKRGVANGIIYAGGGLGGAVNSIATERLIEKLGVAWTYRLIGFLALGTGISAAWFIRERAPVSPKKAVEWYDLIPFAAR